MSNPRGSDNFKGEGNPRRGRPRGSPNRLNAEIKEAIATAFRKVGGVKYLERLARENPANFCQLLAKLVPQELATSEGPLKHEVTLKWMTPEMAKARGFMTDEDEKQGRP